MIKDGGSHSASQDRVYPDHSHAPIPTLLLPKEVRERRAKDREAEKARREAVRQRRMQRAEEKRKAVCKPPRAVRKAHETVSEPTEAVHRVVTGRYDIDTGKIVTEGPIKGRQVMFTMRFDTPTEGRITIFGRRSVPTAMFIMESEERFPEAIGRFIEENREELGV